MNGTPCLAQRRFSGVEQLADRGAAVAHHRGGEPAERRHDPVVEHHHPVIVPGPPSLDERYRGPRAIEHPPPPTGPLAPIVDWSARDPATAGGGLDDHRPAD